MKELKGLVSSSYGNYYNISFLVIAHLLFVNFKIPCLCFEFLYFKIMEVIFFILTFAIFPSFSPHPHSLLRAGEAFNGELTKSTTSLATGPKSFSHN